MNVFLQDPAATAFALAVHRAAIDRSKPISLPVEAPSIRSRRLAASRQCQFQRRPKARASKYQFTTLIVGSYVLVPYGETIPTMLRKRIRNAVMQRHLLWPERFSTEARVDGVRITRTK